MERLPVVLLRVGPRLSRPHLRADKSATKRYGSGPALLVEFKIMDDRMTMNDTKVQRSFAI
jgi:hypothetical protein